MGCGFPQSHRQDRPGMRGKEVPGRPILERYNVASQAIIIHPTEFWEESVWNEPPHFPTQAEYATIEP